MSDSIRVLIADDHPIFRDGLRASLGALEEIEIIGEATSGDEAVAMAERLRPDVVLMDVQMPGSGGIDATAAITTKDEAIRVLMLSMAEDEHAVFAAVRAGASGYLLKGADKDTIARVVRSVAAGEVVFGAKLAEKIGAFFRSGATRSRSAFPSLTDREHEILQLIAQGASNPQIARRLAISDKTVRNHVSNILAKLHAADRSEAASRAREAGLT